MEDAVLHTCCHRLEGAMLSLGRGERKRGEERKDERERRAVVSVCSRSRRLYLCQPPF